MIRALFVPPNRHPWLSQTYVPDQGPDPFKFFRELEKAGIIAKEFEPLRWPWNPFAGKDTLLEGLDPVRALLVAFGQRKIDVIVTNFESSAWTLGLLKAVGLFHPPICVLDVGLTETWKLRRRIQDFVVPRSDGLFVLGSNQVDYIRQTWNVKGQVFMIGHYIDTDFFRPIAAEAKSYVLTVGEDVGRDFPTLMSAMRSIDRNLVIKARRHPPDVSPDDKKIRLITDRISFVDLRRLYAESSVVVVPTHATLNACGVTSILEASGMEKPLVISDNPGIHDYCIPNETCLMVPRGDPQAMQQAIQRLLDDPALAERLGKNARQFIERRFSETAHVALLADGIKSVLNQGRRKSLAAATR